MSGDVTVGYLKKLSALPGEHPSGTNGTLIAGQDYFDVYFAGGAMDGVAIGLNNPAEGIFNGLTETSGNFFCGDVTIEENILQISDSEEYVQLALLSEGASGGAFLSLYNWNGNSSGSLASFDFIVQGGSSPISQPLNSGDPAGQFNWSSFGSGDMAAIIATASADHSNSSAPTKLSFYVTPSGSITLPATPSFALNSDQSVSFGALATIFSSGEGLFSFVSAGSFTPTSSSVAANGIYLPSANVIGIQAGSALALQIAATKTTFIGGGTIGLGPLSVGTWIDMPTSGPSGIGTGGAGSNPWLAYTQLAGQWFTDSQMGDVCYRNATATSLRFGIGPSGSSFVISGSNINSKIDLVQGTAAIATTATAGFLWLPSCAGAPTGAPTSPYTNASAIVIDTTNSKIWVRVGTTWKGVAVS